MSLYQPLAQMLIYFSKIDFTVPRFFKAGFEYDGAQGCNLS